MHITRSILCLILLVAAGCQRGDMDTAVKNGVNEIDLIKQFTNLYPNSEHFITYYTGTKGHPSWTSRIGLHGRYILAVKFKIGFDGSRVHPFKLEEPRFYFSEAKTIKQTDFGFHINAEKRSTSFGGGEWIKLVESSGDLKVLDLSVITNQPLENFDKAWRIID